MTLYNMLCGTDQFYDIALRAAGLEDENVGRFRDAYFTRRRGEGDIVVCVFTRNGGGNRDCASEYCDDRPPCDLTEKNSHKACDGCVITYASDLFENFIGDEDDDFDCTYANMYFSVLPEFKQEVATLIKAHPEVLAHESYGDRFEKIMSSLRANQK